MLIHGLKAQEDLNGTFGSVGDFDETKARWAVKTGRGVSIWVKGISLLSADSMRARIMQRERVLDAGMDEVRVPGL